MSQNAAGGDGTVAELQAQIAELLAENEALRNQLHQYTDGTQAYRGSGAQESAAQDRNPAAGRDGRGGRRRSPRRRAPEDEKLNIVVSWATVSGIWTEGRRALQPRWLTYMDANVYNCAIGGTRAIAEGG